MADHLESIAFTERDHINCAFYFKTGACRHGEKCKRNHQKPAVSKTILLPHMYIVPPVELAIADGEDVDEKAADACCDNLEDFVSKTYDFLGQFGIIEDLVVIDNVGEHFIGNVFVRYSDINNARKAFDILQTVKSDGNFLKPEYSPVTNFAEGRCKRFLQAECDRGGFCNFMHLKHVPRSLYKQLKAAHKEKYPQLYISESNKQPGGGFGPRSLMDMTLEQAVGRMQHDDERRKLMAELYQELEREMVLDQQENAPEY